MTLNYKACRAIKNCLSIRPDAEDSHLFLTKLEKELVHAVLKNWLRSTSRKHRLPTLQFTRSGTPLPHTIKKGTKLEVVRQALGHEYLESTSIYVHLAREMMDKELQKHAL
jgi:site-specific recombinase XerD